ncbi:MAG: MORN repeat protein [uncultured Sulfurovum sp.]|uniref:MORN repeat protein n=1 Tax=uncultured Sulfurovum sp. TaxID=269237 RepID=A0A6S6TFR8_9BACT|nr:MAG: MORN repeat protein [uncultured Sulfurovum sp.]
MKFWIIGLILTNFLSAGDKIALLIGNNDYSFQPLDNPLNDVDGIYKTLREIGFKESNIKVLKNASKIKMESELANFSQRATSAEIALVYFSGHGMQVNNTNYMFPANTTATKPIHLRTLVDLDYFIESASSAKYGIILVDACRNNPLVKYFQNGKHKGSTAKKGLGQVTPTAGQVVIGFATSAGDTAEDGHGNMSPYARALSERLKEPNKDITKVLGLVALDVSGKHEQKPIAHTNLAFDVFLNKGLQKNDEIVIVDGLMYQNQSSKKKYTWHEGKEYCQELTLGGYTNWRVPTKNELGKLFTKKYNQNNTGHKYKIKKEFIKNMLPYEDILPFNYANYDAFFTNTFLTSSKKGIARPIINGHMKKIEDTMYLASFQRGQFIISARSQIKDYIMCVR